MNGVIIGLVVIILALSFAISALEKRVDDLESLAQGKRTHAAAGKEESDRG